MGNRPHLYQLIGIQKPVGFSEWKELFDQTYAETNFLTYTNEMYENIYPVEAWRKRQIEPLKDLLLADIMKCPDEDHLPVMGMLPATKIPHSQLYAKELLHTMIEAGTLPPHAQATKLPYRDVFPLIGKSEMDIAEESDYELVGKEEVEEIQRYTGVWGRKYAQQPLQQFERDLEFAYQFFMKLGLSVSRQDIDRYLVLDYV